MSFLSTFECFGLVIQGYSPEEILARVDQGIAEGRQTMIVTANPEIMLEAKKNSAYWQVLRQADLRIVDGVALQIAGWLSGARPARVAGVDLAERMLQEAVLRHWKVALYGGAPGIADNAAWDIRKAYPEIAICAESGGKIDRTGEGDDADAEARFRLTHQAPDVLLVALSFPGQESWIARHLADFPSVKVAIGVGGTLDYWSGTKTRAPRCARTMGVEWLWRLAHEPSRWRRICRAVCLFPWVVLREQWSKKSAPHEVTREARKR